MMADNVCVRNRRKHFGDPRDEIVADLGVRRLIREIVVEAAADRHPKVVDDRVAGPGNMRKMNERPSRSHVGGLPLHGVQAEGFEARERPEAGSAREQERCTSHALVR